MKVDVYEPLADFAGKEDSWVWIQDYAEDEEYEELDDILRFLNGMNFRNAFVPWMPKNCGENMPVDFRPCWARHFRQLAKNLRLEN